MSVERRHPGGPSVVPGLLDRARLSLPEPAAMRRWLLSDAALTPDGAIVSWANRENPGYPYPEAAGLFLSTLCTAPLEGHTRAAADRVAGWLERSLAANGGAGRGDITYLFDSAIVLAGLLRYRAAGGRVVEDEVTHRLRGFVRDQIATTTAVLPRSAAADGRWSTQFGAHLLKCLHALHLYARAFGKPIEDELVRELINRCGRQPSPVYVHPFCYEQEGHLLIAHCGLCELLEPIDGALEWLAALQQPDGSILAFANGMEGFGEARSDTTAQAVRLWLLGDPMRYGDAIIRALAFLKGCQTPEGGIRYTPHRDDVCSWSTMFALQAVEWVVDRPRLDEIL